MVLISFIPLLLFPKTKHNCKKGNKLHAKEETNCMQKHNVAQHTYTGVLNGMPHNYLWSRDSRVLSYNIHKKKEHNNYVTGISHLHPPLLGFAINLI
jgi:hypothetical protein